MKRKIGKVILPIVLLMVVAVGIVATILHTPAFARPVDQVNWKLGAFTGPVSGTAQDDNIKGSLDLAHTDLDAIIYRKAVAKKAMTSVKSSTPDLFDVDGGAILITDFYGLVTTTIGATVTTLEINFDADTGFQDYDFSTAVAITSDSAGFRYVFSAANESVLTPLEGADGGATNLFKSWFCGEGMIEATASTNDNDGAITWYMEYVPLESGVTVTAQ